MKLWHLIYAAMTLNREQIQRGFWPTG